MATWQPDFDLSLGAGEAVRARSQPRRFERNQFLFHAEDSSDGVFLILAGCVAVRLGTESGNVATIAVVGEGECLGEQSLLADGGRRSATAVALCRVDSLFLSRAALNELRQQDASINYFLASVLDSRLRRVTDRLIEALYTPAPHRVIRRVLELATQFPLEAPIPLTQDDVASMAGTTRPTVNRALRAAEAAGAVRLTRGAIQVLDTAALANLVET